MRTMLPELLAFYRERGHLLVPNFGRTRELHLWTLELRELWRTRELPRPLLDSLDDLAFPFDDAQLSWERSFAGVASLMRRQRRLPPPGTPLGRWVLSQLALADLGKLEPARSGRLKALVRSGNGRRSQ